MRQCKRVKRLYQAFSYIEVSVVLAIFSIGSFLIVPLSLSQLASTRVSYFAADINSFIFATQQDSHSQINGSSHGLRFNTDSYDVFTGNSYATAIDSITVEMNNNVEITDVSLTEISSGSPTTELVFSRGKFKPNAHGTITLSDGSAVYRVTINIEGLSYYEKL